MTNPDYKKKYDELLAQGYSEGDAAFAAADQQFGVAEFRKMREDLPANQELLKNETRINEWKAKYGDKDGGATE